MEGAPDSNVAARRQRVRELAASAEGLARLCACLGTEPDASVREVILVELMKHKGRAVVEGLLPYLRSQDAGLRNAAIEALQEMPADLEPFVSTLLADPDSDTRLMAVNILFWLPHPKVPEWLMQVVLHDEHPNVCAAAAEGLAEVGDETSITALEALPARFPDVAFMTFAVGLAIKHIRGS